MTKVPNHTHTHGDFRLRYGHPLPFGASHVPGGVNFSIFSQSATSCTLVLFLRGEEKPFAEIPLPSEYRLGNVWAVTVFDLNYGEIEFGFRFDGPKLPPNINHFDPGIVLMDPYAREISGRDSWKAETKPLYPFRARVPVDEFDWGHDRPLKRPENDLVIYEMHLRGFTAHPNAEVKDPGTFKGMRDKIPYLKELGVNCVELMPIFEFDEWENTRTNPLTGEQLCNYWGYSTLGFFAPKTGYAATGHLGTQVQELKSLIKALHDADIEVVLDVVFNHTAEGGENGPTYSFRGIDNRTYYMIDSLGRYANYTGCGNTVNCNHPVVRGFVISCLRYWASEFHIDGFRFDLASVLGRDSSGAPLANPPLLESLAYDPVLAHCDLIAEAWDAGGLYQVGNFPSYGRWMEWNGKFRDAARKFIKGDFGVVGEMVQRIMGSPDLYAAAGRKPTASINFITCHDGFTLRDLVSYNGKRNLDNGENNNDGANDNYSWNCGVEGETTDEEINSLRVRQQKNALLLLFVSQGVPMISMGDECGRTQAGNNNAYCQDEEWNWFDWALTEKNGALLRFVKNLIAFRKANAALRQPEFLTSKDQLGSGYPDISWHGIQPWMPDWGASSRTIAFMLCGRHGAAVGGPGNFIYCAFNMYYKPLDFTLPVLPKGMEWHRFADTSLASPEDIADLGSEAHLEGAKIITIHARSSMILIGRNP